ncbi:TPA: hypothetical protein N0F65_002764 [Lagenidium giganteum]|uniref:Uncharacterized protein n=1 Tax=Lagenidium giganteum TaxID=4803 RepID=A0AAV2YLT4_9STRA|nr:TPA: hypothetical protein N0F65_002764 [Lagenidium giganteum]
MGSPDSIRAFSDEFAKSNVELHGLINNAGALFQQEKRTDDGSELSMVVAMGGSYLLTGLMLPLLSKATPKGRVINVSSGGQYLVGLDAADLAGKSRTGANYDGAAAYSYAKRAQVELTKVWADKTHDSGVVFHVMHPVWSLTPGVSSP